MSWFKNDSKDKKAAKNNYFAEAKSWSDDIYGAVEQSKNRYQIAFLASMTLNVVAMLAVTILAPMQSLVPMMVHHYENGLVHIEPVKNESTPLDQRQIESDIVRYVENRESYDLSSYKMQYDLVNLLSTNNVAKEFAKGQSKGATLSPINLLGRDAFRDVHVYSVNFLDNININDEEISKNHHNLAEVVFSQIDTNRQTSRQQTKHYSALISWEYVTPSDVPALRWKNFDGFLVTRYSKKLRNV